MDKENKDEKNLFSEFRFDREKHNLSFYDSIKPAISDAINSFDGKISKSSNTNCLETGFSTLEFGNGNLIVLASRKWLGKTEFSLSLIKKLAVDKKIPVGYINTGAIDNVTIGNKLLSITSGVAYKKIRNGMVIKADLEKLQDAAGILFDAPIYTAINLNCDFAEFVLSVENMLEEQDVKLIIVDGFEYFGELVDADNKLFRYELGTLMDSFKKFAVEHNIPILLVMSLPPAENNEEPGLEDFKRNLIIPYKADMVLFLHKENCKEEHNYFTRSLIISKSIHHTKYDIPLRLDPNTGCFTEKP